ncbi:MULTISPECIES: class IIb bacteriocin, lactobin A/cerein 7B family [unclassified Flavobacterium]|nr:MULTISPECIES: class IIb bacteriocin, lactobin A/cerein 7B family [unclassified Flavobacterium]URC12611.1 class IIb bacteriocin, lactobin A/cerein 7B family [Flavobacterium sp. B183]
MNLENLNLVELNAQEMEEIEGGFLLEILVGVLIGAIAYMLTT